MNPVESRKQLLIAESELNRAQMSGEIAALAAGSRAVLDRARSFRWVATSGAVLLTGMAAIRSEKSSDVGEKPSRLQTALKVAGLISTFWLAFRTQHREQKDK